MGKLMSKVKGKWKAEKDSCKTLFVTGEAKWAKILKPDDYGKFSVNVYIDEDNENYEVLEGMMDSIDNFADDENIKGELADFIKEDDDGKKFFTCKLPQTDFDGKPNRIQIFDASATDVTEDWDKLIGNGSKIVVKIYVKPYAGLGLIGLTAQLYAIQILDLVEYESDGGFTAVKTAIKDEDKEEAKPKRRSRKAKTEEVAEDEIPF